MYALRSRRSLLSSLAAQPKPIGMDRRTLGNTGMKVTPLGLGGRGTTEAGVIQRAIDLGINFIDTGRMYANNERLIGRRRQGPAQESDHRRQDQRQNQAGRSGGPRCQPARPGDGLSRHLAVARKVRSEDVTDELLDALQTAKKAGKVRAVGITTHLNVPAMLAHMRRRGGCDVMLAGYNFTLGPEVTDAIRSARQAGMGIIAMKVLAGGFARIQNSAPRFEGSAASLVQTLRQPGAITAAIRWALRNEFVDTSAVCMSDYDQVEENIKAMSQPYTSADEKLLKAKLAFLRPRYCRMCGACGGVCARGVPVPDILRFLTYAEGYRNFPLARQSYLELPAEARAVRCADCSRCSVKCPNGVRVRERLLRAQELLA
jgi:predicted aldo/keto reductase-like oxidoreductase